jgi:hypothetical protein
VGEEKEGFYGPRKRQGENLSLSWVLSMPVRVGGQSNNFEHTDQYSQPPDKESRRSGAVYARPQREAA